jgi:hypothetical protein
LLDKALPLVAIRREALSKRQEVALKHLGEIGNKVGSLETSTAPLVDTAMKPLLALDHVAAQMADCSGYRSCHVTKPRTLMQTLNFKHD